MSFGHTSIYDDSVLPSALRELTRLDADYPAFSEFVYDDFSFSHKWDIPWVAGRNNSCSRIYIDRHCVIVRRLAREGTGKVSTNVTQFLAIHERREWWAMSKLRFEYERAHHIATAAEHRAVLAAGIDWDSYRSEMRKDIKLDNDPRIERCPPDLDLAPYEEDGNETLLKRILAAQSTKRRSAHALFNR